MQRIAYIRVSTIEQNDQRQIDLINKTLSIDNVAIDKFFSEKVSGKSTDRPQLQSLLKHVREGDIVYIESFSRLSRSTKDLLELIEDFKSLGVELVSIKENLDTSTANGVLMVTMLGAINEFERTNMLERQREGIAIAKSKGVYKGRKSIVIDQELFVELYDQWCNRAITQAVIMEQLGVSRATLNRLIKAHKESLAQA